MKRNVEKKELELFSNITENELSQRLLEIGVDFKHIKNHMVKYFFVIDKIYTHKVFNKENEFCKLNSQLLGKLLGNDYYPQIIKNLKVAGIIQLERNHRNFGTIKESKSYSLIDKNDFFLLTFDGDKHKFAKKILQNRIQRIEKDTQTLSRLFRTLSNIEVDHIDQTNLNEIELMFLHQLQTNKFQVVGQKGKRVYNNFCNLPKSLRGSLRLNNEHLAFVDVVNSQMIFLGALVQDVLSFKNIEPVEQTLRFLELTVSGKIYEFFAERLGVSRNEAKDNLLKMLFSSNRNGSKIKSIFYSEFEQVGGIIKEIKYKDHKVLAHKLQQKEAEIIFRALYTIEFNKEVITCHDSLYAGKSDLNIIVEALVNSFKLVGINATLNVNDEALITVFEYKYHIQSIELDLSPLQGLTGNNDTNSFEGLENPAKDKEMANNEGRMVVEYVDDILSINLDEEDLVSVFDDGGDDDF